MVSLFSLQFLVKQQYCASYCVYSMLKPCNYLVRFGCFWQSYEINIITQVYTIGFLSLWLWWHIVFYDVVACRTWTLGMMMVSDVLQQPAHENTTYTTVFVFYCDTFLGFLLIVTACPFEFVLYFTRTALRVAVHCFCCNTFCVTAHCATSFSVGFMFC